MASFVLTKVTPYQLTVTSPSFKDGRKIPMQYTCEGKNVSPALNISELPAGTKTIALSAFDPDAPNGGMLHWLAWNLPATNEIREGSKTGTQGLNGKKEKGYTGPCPPSGTHHYNFHVYALDTELQLADDASKEALEKAMQGHILAEGELTGLYKKAKTEEMK